MSPRSASSPTSRKTSPSPRARPAATAFSPAALSPRTCRLGNGWSGYLHLQIVGPNPDAQAHLPVEVLPMLRGSLLTPIGNGRGWLSSPVGEDGEGVHVPLVVSLGDSIRWWSNAEKQASQEVDTLYLAVEVIEPG